ncbi:hypothetical protein V5O48_013287 [Marasmius crinis-equi]|uniref:Uncharacterized protein n=1 Tax=Marasmius crinis-equi TaxID=585013 RepID=A0ABR3F0H4_9AGAR
MDPLVLITRTATSVSTANSVSNFVSYSEAGVKSDPDGSETTYVREYNFTEGLNPSGNVVPLSVTGSGKATIVQSSNGFWYSQDYTFAAEGSTSAISEYSSCSLQSDGRYACVQKGPSMTRTFTTTAYDVVLTNVDERESNRARTIEGLEVWQLIFMLWTMVVGGMVML